MSAERPQRPPRVLVVGEYSYDHHEPSLCRGLRAVGAEVVELPLGGPRPVLDALRRAQMKYIVGPDVWRFNAHVLATCLRTRPDVVFAWRTAWLRKITVRALRRLGTMTALYNNDDPFGEARGSRLWRQFRRLVPVVDVCFSYRSVNMDEYRRTGARRVSLLRSWYSAELHRPIELSASDRARFEADATFVGHYADDGRLEALLRLAAAGLRVRVFGGGWEKAGSAARDAFGAIEPVFGEDYVRAVCAAKVALVFLAKSNRDEYTRRCFEIPAMGALMLAPRTEELQSLYEEGEVAFYGSSDELLAQALRFTRDDALRQRVAAAGRARCLRDGHDATARARELLAAMGSVRYPERTEVDG